MNSRDPIIYKLAPCIYKWTPVCVWVHLPRPAAAAAVLLLPAGIGKLRYHTLMPEHNPQERPPALALNCRFEFSRRPGKSVGRRGRQAGDGVHHLANLQLNQRHGFRDGKNAKVINSSTLLLSR
jgi:hypothetical protein